jgi:DNA-binding NtrC family response regulator
MVWVILWTSLAALESAIHGMKLGAFDYLMKPCDLNELVTKIYEATKRRRQYLETTLSA